MLTNFVVSPCHSPAMFLQINLSRNNLGRFMADQGATAKFMPASLEFLDLSHNQLESVARDFKRLVALRELNLEHNLISVLFTILNDSLFHLL